VNEKDLNLTRLDFSLTDLRLDFTCLHCNDDPVSNHVLSPLHLGHVRGLQQSEHRPLCSILRRVHDYI